MNPVLVEELVETSAGPVEIVRVPGERPPVLFFPGGHCSAKADCGWSLYTESIGKLPPISRISNNLAGHYR